MEIKNIISVLDESTKVYDNPTDRTKSTLKISSNTSFNDTLNSLIAEQNNELDPIVKTTVTTNITSTHTLDISKAKIQAFQDPSLAAKSDSAVSRLASALGISKALMLLILNMLGLTPEDLSNPSMKEKVMEKLSGFLLNGKSKKTLGELLDSFYSAN